MEQFLCVKVITTHMVLILLKCGISATDHLSTSKIHYDMSQLHLTIFEQVSTM